MVCWIKAVLITLGVFGGIGLLVDYVGIASLLITDYEGWRKAIGITMLSILGCAFLALLFMATYEGLCK